MRGRQEDRRSEGNRSNDRQGRKDGRRRSSDNFSRNSSSRRQGGQGDRKRSFSADGDDGDSRNSRGGYSRNRTERRDRRDDRGDRFTKRDSRSSSRRSGEGRRQEGRSFDESSQGNRRPQRQVRPGFHDEPREDRIEGRHPFIEAVTAGRTVDKIWLQKDHHFDNKLEQALDEAKTGGAVVLTVERVALDRMSDGRNHQGIVAQIAARDYVELSDLIELAKQNPHPLLIIGDELHDPHNLGALLRVIDAAGAQGLVLTKRRSAGLDAVVAKASAGAIEHVPVAKVGNLQQTIETLKEAGFWTIAADMDGEDLYHSETLQSLISQPLALVMGNEGEGISNKILENADLRLKIPMLGQVNSLNVSVAAAVLAFEIQRQRR